MIPNAFANRLQAYPPMRPTMPGLYGQPQPPVGGQPVGFGGPVLAQPPMMPAQPGGGLIGPGQLPGQPMPARPMPPNMPVAGAPAFPGGGPVCRVPPAQGLPPQAQANPNYNALAARLQAMRQQGGMVNYQ